MVAGILPALMKPSQEPMRSLFGIVQILVTAVSAMMTLLIWLCDLRTKEYAAT